MQKIIIYVLIFFLSESLQRVPNTQEEGMTSVTFVMSLLIITFVYLLSFVLFSTKFWKKHFSMAFGTASFAQQFYEKKKNNIASPVSKLFVKHICQA